MGAHVRVIEWGVRELGKGDFTKDLNKNMVRVNKKLVTDNIGISRLVLIPKL